MRCSVRRFFLSHLPALRSVGSQVRRGARYPSSPIGGFDLTNQAETDERTKRLVGWLFTVDRPASYSFHDRINNIQLSIDKALPAGRSNRLYCGRCETSRVVVAGSRSDRQPGEYFLHHSEKLSIERIGAAMP